MNNLIFIFVFLTTAVWVDNTYGVPFHEYLSRKTRNVIPDSHQSPFCNGDFDFDCGEGELRQRCISGLWTCDHIYDCTTGADEVKCKYQHQCPLGYFTCRNGDCFLATKRCDSHQDCLDGSDERACSSNTLMNIQANQQHPTSNVQQMGKAVSSSQSRIDHQHFIGNEQLQAEAMNAAAENGGPSFTLIFFTLTLLTILAIIVVYCINRHNPDATRRFDHALKEFNRKVVPISRMSSQRSPTSRVNVLSSPNSEQFFDNPMNTMQQPQPLVLNAATAGGMSATTSSNGVA